LAELKKINQFGYSRDLVKSLGSLDLCSSQSVGYVMWDLTIYYSHNIPQDASGLVGIWAKLLVNNKQHEHHPFFINKGQFLHVDLNFS